MFSITSSHLYKRIRPKSHEDASLAAGSCSFHPNDVKLILERSTALLKVFFSAGTDYVNSSLPRMIADFSFVIGSIYV